MNIPTAPNPARKKQRLVVCLDGSWNWRDSNTNVLHHFTLTLESEPPTGVGAVIQKKYYDEGVGTGVIDGVTGGAFGFGLEENVREAYNWLSEHYHDRDEETEADEIFIFGFSRGAYTARSLVGFIATFGLLRHGAPLSVTELWSHYGILGREYEGRKSFWDRIFKVKPSAVKPIKDLTPDPWDLKPGEAPAEPAETAERLLVRWSRRVKITYLGIYETVGALGIDALAIPGVKSKLAMHHNLRVTSLIQSCRHALAVDEHRISFSRTPLVEYVEHERHGSDEESRKYWTEQRDAWRARIQQRWFVGAHSNIGGGYPENELSQPPLAWVLEGARKAGLECEPFAFDGPKLQPAPKDSYAEFVKPYWTQIVRGKRYYRTIDPEPEVRAKLKNDKAGVTLRNINEQVDATVLDYYGKTDCPGRRERYCPPNVWEYARRRRNSVNTTQPLTKEEQRLGEIADNKNSEPRHPWVGEKVSAHVILVLWGTFAGIGMLALNHLFSAVIDDQLRIYRQLPLWFVAGAALFFTLVDWGESAANFALAKGPSSARWRAFLDTIYWTRTLGFVLFVCGALATPVALWLQGWHADTIGGALTIAWEQIEHWWLVPVAAAVGVLLGTWRDNAPSTRRWPARIGSVGGCLTAYTAVVMVVALGWWFGQVFTPVWGHTPAKHLLPTPHTQVAGLLLLLQFGFFYLIKTCAWAREPTSRRNFGSVVALQRCFTPRAVERCLGRWQKALTCDWSAEDQDTRNGPAARTMREAIREALWRDVLGFIPLYGLVFTFGLYFAAWELEWSWLHEHYARLPLWLWLPAVAIAADLCEDACHLRYLALNERSASIPAGLTLFSGAMTCLKSATILMAGALTFGALVVGPHHVLMLGDTGWRGTLAMLVARLTALLVGVGVIIAIISRVRNLWMSAKTHEDAAC